MDGISEERQKEIRKEWLHMKSWTVNFTVTSASRQRKGRKYETCMLVLESGAVSWLCDCDDARSKRELWQQWSRHKRSLCNEYAPYGPLLDFWSADRVCWYRCKHCAAADRKVMSDISKRKQLQVYALDLSLIHI